MPLSRASGLVAPDDLVDEVLLAHQLVEHHLYIVRRMPVQMHPHQAVVCQKVPHQKEPHGHVPDVVCEIPVELVVVREVMHLPARSRAVSDIQRGVEARAREKRRIDVYEPELPAVTAPEQFFHVLEVVPESQLIPAARTVLPAAGRAPGGAAMLMLIQRGAAALLLLVHLTSAFYSV